MSSHRQSGHLCIYPVWTQHLNCLPWSPTMHQPHPLAQAGNTGSRCSRLLPSNQPGASCHRPQPAGTRQLMQAPRHCLDVCVAVAGCLRITGQRVSGNVDPSGSRCVYARFDEKCTKRNGLCAVRAIALLTLHKACSSCVGG